MDQRGLMVLKKFVNNSNDVINSLIVDVSVYDQSCSVLAIERFYQDIMGVEPVSEGIKMFSGEANKQHVGCL